MKPAYSMKRGYRVLFLHCDQCEVERPFFRINSWPSPQKRIVRKVGTKFVAQESPNPIPNLPAEDRLVNATCMICATAAQYVVSEVILNNCRHAMGDLCKCGLPAFHLGCHLEELRASA